MNAMRSRSSESQQDSVLPARSVCPACTSTSGEITPRTADPKKVHKCQVCRSELLPSFAAELPKLKEAKRAEMRRSL